MASEALLAYVENEIRGLVEGYAEAASHHNNEVETEFRLRLLGHKVAELMAGAERAEKQRGLRDRVKQEKIPLHRYVGAEGSLLHDAEQGEGVYEMIYGSAAGRRKLLSGVVEFRAGGGAIRANVVGGRLRIYSAEGRLDVRPVVANVMTVGSVTDDEG